MDCSQEDQISFEDFRSSLVVRSSSLKTQWKSSRNKKDNGPKDMEVDHVGVVHSMCRLRPVTRCYRPDLNPDEGCFLHFPCLCREQCWTFQEHEKRVSDQEF